jgi:hypothetical protein
MIGANAYVSRHPLDGNSELIAVADDTNGASRLIAVERSVARRFASHDRWPHRRVNLFIFENLQPLIDQLQRASRTLGEGKNAAAAAFHGLEDKPMVHTYNLADLGECSIFVNRTMMQRLGMWEDEMVLEGLLAHEHAHPLAENAVTRTTRNMKVTFTECPDKESGEPAPASSWRSLELLAHELCLHAPHEVFTNELAIQVGFAESLFALNRMSLIDGRAGVQARNTLAAHLKSEIAGGRLSENAAALLLLQASLEAHVRVALETSAFTRAGCTEQAGALEELLWQEALRHIEPEVGEVYRQLCTSYLALNAEMDAASVCDWATAAFAPITNAIAHHNVCFTASFHF